MPHPLSERVLYSKKHQRNKRAKVKLVELINRKNQKWFYIMIGSVIISRTQSLAEAKREYARY